MLLVVSRALTTPRVGDDGAAASPADVTSYPARVLVGTSSVATQQDLPVSIQQVAKVGRCEAVLKTRRLCALAGS
jgi:hypothetical protein